MKRVLFLTNYASPYRVTFFDELGKDLDVTVLFSERIEDKKHRSADWFVQGQGNFKIVQLTRRIAKIGGRDLCTDVTGWLKKPFDAIVVCGYSSPTAMLAIAYLRLKRIPFYIEIDGGLIREDSGFRYRFKRMLVSSASWWISSGRYPTKYLVHYGAKEDAVFEYPFSSLREGDIAEAPPSAEKKQQLRKALGMTEEKIVLYVGRYDPKKGMDDLLYTVPALDRGIGVYFVGGEPTQEHLQFREDHSIANAHFIGFKKKEELALYYQAADLLVLPTYSDVWGLVINEAMAFGLPIVTTDRCVAGLELVEDGVNGCLVPVGDREALASGIREVLSSDPGKMGAASLEKIRPYTLENMAKVHVAIFEKNQ